MADLDLGEIARSAARSLEAIAIRPPAWKPLPHQIPPPGEWYGWLLNAGRGSGKTDAVANYVVEHVRGKPCLPGGTPHWIGIIAPTLGDAVTACYAGPSGIKAHDPSARLVQSAGGTVIRWPNGSEAKLFGAQAPEDVERLRAGGNRCLAAGTFIKTRRGDIKIEDVTTTDYVWTRNGLRRVLRAGQTGERELWQLETESSHNLNLTYDHQVWSNGEWCEVGNLKPGYTLDAWDYSSNMTVSGGINGKMATTPTPVEDCFIGMFGFNIMGQFQVGCTCTTEIMTARTTLSTTWSCSHLQSTLPVIPDEMWERATGLPDSPPGTDESFTRLRAACAENHFNHERCGRHGFADAFSAVSHSHIMNLGHHEREKNGCALCAEIGSLPLNEDPPKRVQDRVRRISRLERVEPVYDLLIEHDHEFFANNILVANCLTWLEELAAWRYLQACWEQMRFGLRVGPRPHWVASTTPKPRPLIKKLVKTTPHNVVVTTASTYDNPHLPDEIQQALNEEYGSTQLGRQELNAELLEEDRDALWKRDTLERYRIMPDIFDIAVESQLIHLSKITVGVDPSGGAGEQGIVVVGRGTLLTTDIEGGAFLKPGERAPMHGFVIADKTCCLSPHGWGRKAVQAALDADASDIVVERNYGGDMAVATIQDACDSLNVTLPVRTVNASRGKRVRAEPVSALSERGRWHLVGSFPELEDQLCTWTPESDYSPDRLDAMVWPAWHLKLATTRSRGVGQLPLSEFANTKIAQ